MPWQTRHCSALRPMLCSRRMQGIESILYGIGIAGVAAQAAAGVLDAGRKPFDMFGIVVVALAASLGGPAAGLRAEPLPAPVGAGAGSVSAGSGRRTPP